MKMLVRIEAIVRPEKTEQILVKLAEKGHTAVTRMDVYGRGKQAGIHIGDVFYDELPKELLFIVAEKKLEREIVDVITTYARTSETGNYGDGRIFVHAVENAYTISNGTEGL